MDCLCATQSHFVKNHCQEKILILWYCLMKFHGISFTSRNPKKTYWFAIFLTVQVLSALVITVPVGMRAYLVPTTPNVVMFLTSPLITITGVTYFVVLYKRQKSIYNLFKQLLIPLDLTLLQKSWNFLMMFIIIISFVIMLQTALHIFEFSSLLTTNGMLYKILLDKAPNSTLLKDRDKYKSLFPIGMVLFNYSVYSITGFGVIFCVSLFDLISKNFVKIENSISTIHLAELIKLQRSHERICQLTAESSKVLSPFILVLCINSSIGACFMCKVIFIDGVIEWRLVMLLLHTFREFLLLFLFYKKAAEVNGKANKTAVFIANLKCKSGTSKWKDICLCQSENLIQSVFIQRYSMQTTGIDVSGLFVITNRSILSLVGALLTYVIILQQTS